MQRDAMRWDAMRRGRLPVDKRDWSVRLQISGLAVHAGGCSEQRVRYTAYRYHYAKSSYFYTPHDVEGRESRRSPRPRDLVCEQSDELLGAIGSIRA